MTALISASEFSLNASICLLGLEDNPVSELI